MTLMGIKTPIKRPHWLAIRELGDKFYNLDSKCSSPLCIGGQDELKKYLADQLCLSGTELLIIKKKVGDEEHLGNDC